MKRPKKLYRALGEGMNKNQKSIQYLKKTDASPLQGDIPHGYDPELLYVECGRCGAPVLWDDGRATSLLREAGIDPLELDASCLLVTDGCPACASRHEFSVKICRIGSGKIPPTYGHA